MLNLIRGFVLSLIIIGTAPALAGQATLLGVGLPTVVVSGYSGPGDVFPTALAWYSCSRGYSAAYAASGTGPACDVVDTATGLITCTYHVGTSGFVNPSECTGGGQSCQTACSISRVYDQTGHTRNVEQSVLASMPALTFNSTPKGTLPAINCGTGASSNLQDANPTTQAPPLTGSAVFIRNTATAEGGVFGDNTSIVLTGSASGANLAEINDNATILTKTATDNSWHAVNVLLNGGGTSSAINVDGSDTTGAGGTTGFSGGAIRLCRAFFSQHTGLIAEAGAWAASSTSTNRNSLSTNQHSASSGYNF